MGGGGVGSSTELILSLMPIARSSLLGSATAADCTTARSKVRSEFKVCAVVPAIPTPFLGVNII